MHIYHILCINITFNITFPILLMHQLTMRLTPYLLGVELQQTSECRYFFDVLISPNSSFSTKSFMVLCVHLCLQ